MRITRWMKTKLEEADSSERAWMSAFDKAVGAKNPLVRKAPDYWKRAKELYRQKLSPDEAAAKMATAPKKSAPKPPPKPPEGGAEPPAKDA